MKIKTDFSIEKVRALSENSVLKLSELSEILKKLNAGSTEWIEHGLAMCCIACSDGLSLTPYDEQLLAAKYLFDGRIVEMATGEGKTISAVFAAFLNSALNKRTHILTFNDYLAKRDFNWMKPIYDRLNVSVSYITEKTPPEKRREYYLSDVVYTTVKESGFDYLRDFIVFDEKDAVHCGLACAIVDEADSILIDEARIPLAIAGEIPADADAELYDIFEFVSKLPEKAYGFSEEDKGVYPTDYGVELSEKHYNIQNLYDTENSFLLSLLNDCLRAAFYLKEDKDYIVKDGEIKIVDEFTGRAAKNRRYPGSLHAAVEVKHGLKISARGVTMGTVPIQFFMRQYPNIAGMTGTAAASAEEFELLYGLMLAEVPPHVPSGRIDYPTQIYYDGKIKRNEIIKAILKAHEKGQPVLVGTGSIEESERLAKTLKENGILNVSVLNAKNDEAEAEILKNAGAYNSVTISTNMAGRGVDILLGGADNSDIENREKVIKAGGLQVISTRLHDSSRINNQLRGRCGRQGDVGESRVFCALDDEIMLKYGLKKLIPPPRYPEYTEDIITDKAVAREVARIQRISEGDTLDERKRLLKFTVISEKHREAIFNTRMKYIKNELSPSFWQDKNPAGYKEAVKRFGEKKTGAIQKELIASVINDAWVEYLEFTSELRGGIHLTSVGGKNPSEEFNIASEEFYRDMPDYVENAMLEQLDVLLTLDKAEDFVIKKPERIWTFLLDESGDELVKKPFLINAVSEHTDIDETEEAENYSDNVNNVNEKKGFFSGIFKKKNK